jgi:hypothetical protein
MLFSLAAGTAVILATVLIHAVGLIGLTRATTWLAGRFPMHGSGSIVAIVAVVLGLFALMTIEVWLWALCYRAVGAFTSFEAALYFSTATFSTLGFGDVLPGEGWDLFAALQGVDGFLLIGWSTAYLAASSARLGLFRSEERH